MSIPISQYVDITSGVGGASNVATRNLGGMVITGNSLAPTGQVLNFSSALAVGTYFGTGSEEYARAVFYFGFVSKNITAPQQISFWNWNNDSATASLIFGTNTIDTLTQFNTITSGNLTLTLGGFTHELTAIDLSAAGSLAAVATDVTTAINAYSAGGSAWTGAVVSYSNTSGGFNLVSGATGTDVVAVAISSGSDLAGPLGWTTGAIFSNGTAAQTCVANFNQLVGQSNNFGSLCYTTALAVTEANLLAVANANNALVPNIQFMMSIQVSIANASSWSAAFIDIGGCTLTLASPVSTEYPEMAPMMILAATDYTKRNSVQNYMFQEFALTPSVTTLTQQQLYDGLLINYYGQTQTAGQLLSFYQRGVMMGLPVDPSDQNVYADELWFKDALGAALMNLLLGLPQIPANTTGQSQILASLQSSIQQALFNGTISIGKTLTTNQQLYITEVTGISTAWQQVQNVGNVVSVVIMPYVVNSRTEYKAVYSLVYSKDDTIRLIQGTDTLI